MTAELDNFIGFKNSSIFDPAFKGAIYVWYDLLSVAKEKIGPRILEESFLTIFMGLYIDNKDKIYNLLNFITQSFFEGGLIDREWYCQLKSEHRVTKYVEIWKSHVYDWKHRNPEGAKVLKFNDLEAGFAVWMATLSLGFVAFAIEWLVRLKEYLKFKYLIAKYLN